MPYRIDPMESWVDLGYSREDDYAIYHWFGWPDKPEWGKFEQVSHVKSQSSGGLNFGGFLDEVAQVVGIFVPPVGLAADLAAGRETSIEAGFKGDIDQFTPTGRAKDYAEKTISEAEGKKVELPMPDNFNIPVGIEWKDVEVGGFELPEIPDWLKGWGGGGSTPQPAPAPVPTSGSMSAPDLTGLFDKLSGLIKSFDLNPKVTVQPPAIPNITMTAPAAAPPVIVNVPQGAAPAAAPVVLPAPAVPSVTVQAPAPSSSAAPAWLWPLLVLLLPGGFLLWLLVGRDKK